jgi:O-antigen/teichoic acid export membrane protein
MACKPHKAVSQTFLTNLAIQGCNVVTGVLTARLLAPEGRGELATVILWPTILAGLGIMGTNWALAREAAAQPDKEADLARTAMVLGLGQSAVFMFLGFFLLPALIPADKQHLIGLARLFLLFLPLNFVALNLIALDQGRLRWGRYNLVRLSVVLPYLVLLVWFWAVDIKQVSYFVWALLITNLFTVLLRLVWQYKQILRGRFSFAEAGNILRRGFAFFLAAVSGLAALQVDKAMVVGLLPTESVGLYAAAFTFASAHASLGGALGTTSFAAMANEPDERRQGQYLAKVFRQASLLYVGAGAAVALLAPVLIAPLFGAEFGPAAIIAAVLALATSLTGLGQILNEGLRGAGNPYPGIVAQCVGGALVAAAAYLLVPVYGLMGIALAAVGGALGALLILIATGRMVLVMPTGQLWGFRMQEIQDLYGRVAAFLSIQTTMLKKPGK